MFSKSDNMLICVKKTVSIKHQIIVNHKLSMAGFGRELPFTLHQNKRQLSGNASVSTRLTTAGHL